MSDRQTVAGIVESDLAPGLARILRRLNATRSAEPFDPGAWPRKLNVGCGWDRRDGYLNIDFLAFHGPDMVADVRDLSALPDDYYDELVAQDVLEHLTRADGPVALREWARVLRAGGSLVLRVPNPIGLAVLMTRQRTLEDQRNFVQCMFGTQAYDGDFHQNGYTEYLLRYELWSAGFEVAKIEDRDGWLFEVVATRVAAPGPEPSWEDCSFMALPAPSESASAEPQQSVRELTSQLGRRVARGVGRRIVARSQRVR